MFYTETFARRPSPLAHSYSKRQKKVTLTVTTRNGEERAVRYVWGNHHYVPERDIWDEFKKLVAEYPNHYVFISR